MSEDQLIFIISQPRAGSTMLQAVLSNNEEVDTVSEPWIQLPFMSIFKDGMNEAKYNSGKANYVVKDFLNKYSLNAYVKQEIKELLLNIYGKVKRGTYRYFIDKTPRYYEILNELYENFPEAKFIVLKRNPIAVLKSIIQTWEIQKYDQLYEYHRDILNAPILICQFIDQFGSKNNVMEIHYEDLVSIEKGDHSFQQLYNWLGIEYNSGVMNYDKNIKHVGVYGDPIGVRRRQKVDNNTKNNIIVDTRWSSFFHEYHNYLKNKNLINKYRTFEISYVGKPNRIKLKLDLFLSKIFSRDSKYFDFHFFIFGVKNKVFKHPWSGENQVNVTLRTFWKFNR